MDKEILIQRYFSNSLSKEEKVLFDDLLKNNQQFSDQFHFEQDLQKAISDQKRTELKSKLMDFEKDTVASPNNGKSSVNYKKWLVAASIVVLLGLGYLQFSNPNLNTLYNDNFQVYPNTEVSITRGEDAETVERTAFIAYETGDYEKALQLFMELPEQPYINFYKAQCYLQLEQFSKAVELFKLNVSKGTKYIPESYWYMALANLKLGDEEKAKDALTYLVQHFDYHKEKAKELISRLE